MRKDRDVVSLHPFYDLCPTHLDFSMLNPVLDSLVPRVIDELGRHEPSLPLTRQSLFVQQIQVRLALSVVPSRSIKDKHSGHRPCYLQEVRQAHLCAI